ncbi:MAG: fasciclin domain-containing protein [Chitinophagaceae bacterium]|nr:fasciclin domain-containing protein [Chitinophagaceae bacterium]
MKRFILLFTAAAFAACNSGTDNNKTSSSGTTFDTHSQAGVVDSTSQPNVVQVAIGSKDHTTLVEAVKAADLVTSLSNAGPFTVFAPTNAAFDKLPKGTVEDLLKPAKKNDLINVLQYHVYVGVLKEDQLRDGMLLGMVNGDNIKITMENGKPVINGKAHIVASVPASNGIVHVIDDVLLPPAK